MKKSTAYNAEGRKMLYEICQESISASSFHGFSSDFFFFYTASSFFDSGPSVSLVVKSTHENGNRGFRTGFGSVYDPELQRKSR